jgi:hypothetical protein
MKKLLFAALMIASSTASAWYGGYGANFGVPMGYYGGGMPYYGGFYGGYGYGAYPIQGPTFTYNTVIQQSPPIIINLPPQGQPRQAQTYQYPNR